MVEEEGRVGDVSGFAHVFALHREVLVEVASLDQHGVLEARSLGQFLFELLDDKRRLQLGALLGEHFFELHQVLQVQQHALDRVLLDSDVQIQLLNLRLQLQLFSFFRGLELLQLAFNRL